MKLSVDMPVGLDFEPWSDDRRNADMAETLAAAPDPERIWVFGYGSLIWDPRFEPAERRLATLRRHRRSFCFWTTRGRGSPERPGLGLGVIPCDSSIRGVAFRLKRDDSFDAVTDALWRREMAAGVYHARWLPLETDGGHVQAIVYVANDGHRNYVGELPIDEQAWIMAGARGPLGYSYEYLGYLVQEFERLGIEDARHNALYERIMELVRTAE